MESEEHDLTDAINDHLHNNKNDQVEDQAMDMIDHKESVDINDSIDNEEQDEKGMGSVLEMINDYNSKEFMMITCCVPGCGVRFPYREGYKFRWKDKRQMYFWLTALGKMGKHANSPSWRPTKFDRICKFHFIGNRPSIARNMINYIPTKIQAPSNTSLPRLHASRFPVYKKFRMSYCWYTGWSLTNERGDNHDKVSKLLRNCWDQEFKDCRIICKGGVAVICHSVVLAMSSPVFKKLLLTQEADETKVIMLPDFSVNTVSTFIRHCYCLDTVQEKESKWKEIQSLLSVLKVKGCAVSHNETKRSNRLVIKRAKMEVNSESPNVPEYEVSTEPEIILVSHSNVAKCCPRYSRNYQTIIQVDRNPADPMYMELKACKEFIEQEIITHPSWMTETSAKNGFVLNDEGTVSYEKISSSITFKTKKVVVEKVNHEVVEEKTSVPPLNPREELLEEEMDASNILEKQVESEVTEDQNPNPVDRSFSEPINDPSVEHMTNEEIPCTFGCATCTSKIKTTIAQHNLLVMKINEKMRDGEKKPSGVSSVLTQVFYQCKTCQKNGIKITEKHSKKSWGFLRPFKCKAEQVLKTVNDREESENTAVLCSKCGLQCKNIQFLEWHMNEHEGIKPYTCDQCNVSYHNPLSLKGHQGMMHSTVLKEKCSLCDEIIVCRKGQVLGKVMETHMKSNHSGNEPFKCEECNYGGKTASVIAHHIERCHPNSSTNLIPCDKCPSVICRRKMRLHQMKHHDPKIPFECDQCQFRSVSKYGIINHKGRHHKTDRVACGNGCGQTFAQAMTMRWHMKRFCSMSDVKEDMIKREDKMGISQKKAERQAKNRSKLAKQYQEALGTCTQLL